VTVNVTAVWSSAVSPLGTVVGVRQRDCVAAVSRGLVAFGVMSLAVGVTVTVTVIGAGAALPSRFYRSRCPDSPLT